MLFAAGCGLALALLGVASHGTVYGTGYDQARGDRARCSQMPGQGFGIEKLLANVVSYWAGIPGGIFSPALAVGAGLGQNIAHFLPGAPVAAVVLLGMSAYLAGVTGAPLTSAVIAMELTNNQDMVIPIMAACLLARAAASLFCPTPCTAISPSAWCRISSGSRRPAAATAEPTDAHSARMHATAGSHQCIRRTGRTAAGASRCRPTQPS